MAAGLPLKLANPKELSKESSMKENVQGREGFNWCFFAGARLPQLNWLEHNFQQSDRKDQGKEGNGDRINPTNAT